MKDVIEIFNGSFRLLTIELGFMIDLLKEFQ